MTTTQRSRERASLALEIRAQIRSCDRCGLSTQCRGPVPWKGDLDATWLVLGEAPGTQEDKDNKPFTGPSGWLMNKLFKEVGFPLDEIAYMNAVSCFPHRNPSNEEIIACRPNLNAQLQLINPAYIITTGQVALRALTQRKWPKLQDLHGKPLFWDSPFNHRHTRLFPTYHPASAFTRRDKSAKEAKRYEQMIRDDLMFVRRAVENNITTLEECYVCGDTLYTYDGWGTGYCKRHALRQGELFPEDM